MKIPEMLANPSAMLFFSCVVLLAGYVFYGGFIARRLGVDPSRTTPANEINDGLDYVPARMPVLLGHHFASIAGAAPIVGPIAAAVFGWLPVLLWILLGGIFAGAVQDMSALMVSIRHGGRSIGEVIREHMGPTGHRLFLTFSFSALILVIGVFAILVARTFIQSPQAATTSLLFMAVAILFGIMVRWLKMGIFIPTILGLALVTGSIWAGLKYPLSIYLAAAKFNDQTREALWSEGSEPSGQAKKVSPSPKDLPGMVRLFMAASAHNPTPQRARERIQGHFDTRLANFEKDSKAALAGKTALFNQVSEIEKALARFGAEQIGLEKSLETAREKLGVLETGLQKIEREIADTKEGRKTALADLAAAEARAFDWWLWFLFAYVFVASVVPVWLLLQPRDYLSSFLLYALIVGAMVGIALSSFPAKVSTAGAKPESLLSPIVVKLPAFTQFHTQNPGPLFPFLFVVVACGAISGFHSLVASGTTSKQLASEADARPVGFGGMLIESLLAVIALITAAVLPREQYAAAASNPVALFANGVGGFMARAGIPTETAVSFTILAVSAFALTSLDTATRLARFCFQEFFTRYEYDAHGERVKSPLENRFVATAAAVVPGALLAFSGRWQEIWPIFGAANQLLASLALLSVGVWLIKTGRGAGPALVPMVLMMATTMTALVLLVMANLGKSTLLAGASGLLIALALILMVQGGRTILRN